MKKNIILIIIFCLLSNIIHAKNLETNELESHLEQKEIDTYEDWEVDK